MRLNRSDERIVRFPKVFTDIINRVVQVKAMHVHVSALRLQKRLLGVWIGHKHICLVSYIRTQIKT